VVILDPENLTFINATGMQSFLACEETGVVFSGDELRVRKSLRRRDEASLVAFHEINDKANTGGVEWVVYGYAKCDLLGRLSNEF
jgi:hypothetical protein